MAAGKSLDSQDTWQRMPAELLPYLLQFVGCKQRLNHCAQVAHAWKAAVAATTKDVHTTLTAM